MQDHRWSNADLDEGRPAIGEPGNTRHAIPCASSAGGHQVFPVARRDWFRRPGRVVRADGEGPRRAARMARQATDARRDRGLPDNAWPARCAGGHLRGLPALRLLGCLGEWLGTDPASVGDGGTAGHSLCPPAWPAVADRDHLWRKPGGHRAHPAILVAVGPAGNGGSVSIRRCHGLCGGHARAARPSHRRVPRRWAARHRLV